jgi:hypothetical protein
MMPNPIEDIKRIRHELGVAVDYDVARIFAGLRDQRSRSGRTYVDAPEPAIADNNCVNRSGESRGI